MAYDSEIRYFKKAILFINIRKVYLKLFRKVKNILVNSFKKIWLLLLTPQES